MNTVLTKEIIELINLCEKVIRTKVKDLYQNESLTLIVNKGDASKAIGKNGMHIKKLSSLLKKRIKIVEFDEDPVKFTENYILPVKGKIYKENEAVVIEINDFKTKGILIGRNRKNINHLQKILKSYFNLEIKVL